VEFETPFGPNDTNFSEDHLSFAERFIYSVFRRLDVDQRRYGADIVVFGRGSWNGTGIKQAALDVLTRSGFTGELPDLNRVGCLSRESVSVLISISDVGKLVKFEMGGDSREAIEGAVRELVAAFPDAKVMKPPAERTEEL
jgi:hypothetical protein